MLVGVVGLVALLALAAALLLVRARSTALESAVESCHLGDRPRAAVLRDGGRTLFLDGLDGGVLDATEAASSSGAGLVDITCVLNELDAPSSLLSEMAGTRAADGTQSTQWDTFSASWTYDLDDGLDVTIEQK